MAVATHKDDHVAYHGAEGVLARRNLEGRIVSETPGRRSHSTTGAQKVSG
jgi:hypothetical protein